jgi:hypothetical protein
VNGTGQGLDQRAPAPRDVRRQREGVRGRHAHELGGGAIQGHAQGAIVLAEVASAHPAEPAVAAREVGIDRHEISDAKIGDAAAGGDDLAAELVAGHDRIPRRRNVAFQQMQVGAADARRLHAENGAR